MIYRHTGLTDNPQRPSDAGGDFIGGEKSPALQIILWTKTPGGDTEFHG